MKTRYALAGSLTALVVATSASSASAQDAHGFGEKSQLIVSGDRLFPLFSYTSATITTPNNVKTSINASNVSLLYGRESFRDDIGAFNPHSVPRVAFDVTIIPHLTLGGAVIVAFGLGGSTEVETPAPGGTVTRRFDSPTTTVFGFAPRVGYIIPVGDVLAFWPRGGFSFYSVSTKQDNTPMGGGATQTETITNSLFSLEVDPQLVIVPIQHVFFSAGPLLTIPLTGTSTDEDVSGATTTTVDRDLTVVHLGLNASLGFWFNL